MLPCAPPLAYRALLCLAPRFLHRPHYRPKETLMPLLSIGTIVIAVGKGELSTDLKGKGTVAVQLNFAAPSRTFGKHFHAKQQHGFNYPGFQLDGQIFLFCDRSTVEAAPERCQPKRASASPVRRYP
jgi:hypothetical protein